MKESHKYHKTTQSQVFSKKYRAELTLSIQSEKYCWACFLAGLQAELGCGNKVTDLGIITYSTKAVKRLTMNSMLYTWLSSWSKLNS